MTDKKTLEELKAAMDEASRAAADAFDAYVAPLPYADKAADHRAYTEAHRTYTKARRAYYKAKEANQ